MPSPLDLNLFATFVAVADAASFSKAAALLRAPKSSVSRAITELEATLGVRLLNRTTRSVSLSTAGLALYEHVKPGLHTLQEAVSFMPEREDEPSGTLRITAPVDFGVQVLTSVVARFITRFPKVSVDLRLSNIYLDITAEGIDLALRISASSALKDSSLHAKKLGLVRFALYASPDYLARQGAPKTSRELSAGIHAWVNFRNMKTIRLEGLGETVMLKPTGRVVCDEMSFVQLAVKAGLGLGFLPMFLTRELVQKGELVRIMPKAFAQSGAIWAVTPASKHLPRKVSAFLDVLKEGFAERITGV
jgi:DNA-binding transcriptional LysR family regulator